MLQPLVVFSCLSDVLLAYLNWIKNIRNKREGATIKLDLDPLQYKTLLLINQLKISFIFYFWIWLKTARCFSSRHKSVYSQIVVTENEFIFEGA